LAPEQLPALITAGGRLSPDFAAHCGTDLKALALLGKQMLIERVIAALRESGLVSTIGIVGPVERLQGAGVRADLWIEEGQTGPENIQRGIAALRESGSLRSEERLVICATDVAFLHADTIRELHQVAEQRPDADIVFPIVRGETYDTAFPGSPNTYAPLADGRFTGSSVQIVRPDAITRNLPLIEKAFAARKSQMAMAQLLGLPFILRFVTRTLTVAAAEARVGAVTGLRCHAPVFTDARIAADVDLLADYQYACRFIAEREVDQKRTTVTGI